MPTIVSWNVLADDYVKRAHYPRTEARHLDPGWRRPAIVARAAALGADVLCLQEVDRATLDALTARLELMGYAGEHSWKHGKPDGCAVFWRKTAFERGAARAVYFRDRDSDAGEDSGHLALLVTLAHEGRVLGVATTHLKWDPPETALERQRGLRQARELVQALEADACKTWIVCGDLNVTKDTPVVRLLGEKGWVDPFPDGAATCNANGNARKIDWLFFPGDLVATAHAVPAIGAETALPAEGQPSDHLALGATFGWRETARSVSP